MLMAVSNYFNEGYHKNPIELRVYELLNNKDTNCCTQLGNGL